LNLTKVDFEQLAKIGFQKFKIKSSKRNSLLSFKKDVENISKKILRKKNIILDEIHNKNFENSSFNEFRLKVFSEVNKINKIHHKIFDIYSDIITNLIGPDISVQKNINFSIQRPFDEERAPFHRDSPPNSPFEIVVWLPLVDCQKDMSMYLFNINDKQNINNYLKNDKNQNHDQFAKKKGKCCECKFGEFIIFIAGAYHYIPINTQKRSRWSINVRYKNTFSPYGLKGYLDFFEPLKYSHISNLAINHE
tara:strand:- start:439 stop:1188 length:750 start_codon:yes stop_codon:yes gene_type:complete